MTRKEAVAHHEETLRLWESIGRERITAPRAADERRRAPRFLVPDRPCRVVLDDPGAQRSFEAVVHDVTARGACLHGPCACTIDRRISVVPPAEGDSPPPVSARVTSCRLSTTGYRIGVEFIEPD